MSEEPQTRKLARQWDLSPTEAVALQRQLRQHVDVAEREMDISRIAGTDLSYDEGSDLFYAGIVVLDYESMDILGSSSVVDRAPFPYVPGLLSFRELPALMKAWKALPLIPDVVICDGHGIAHPRRLGIATHFGMATGTPSIGCAKKILTGEHEPLPPGRGSYRALKKNGEMIGYALRSRDNIKPVYVSPGHLIGHKLSREIVLHCARGYKLPEPTRQAHKMVNRLRRGEEDPGTRVLGE